ncbi:MAG TPA: hypothetical protein DEA77_06325 [Acinetobacter nosocomialis]|nr:hypothetical protein [Acinetobacter nosocomialis]
MSELLKFKYIPLLAGYSGETSSGVISQKLDGGRDRNRRISKNNWSSVSCSFKFDELGYQYIQAFYRVWQRNPSKPFLLEMFLDDPVVQEYECQFVPDSVKLNSKNGIIYNVTVQLSVKPLKVDEEADDAVIMLVNDDIGDIPEPLKKLVNEDLPRATEGI